MKTLQIDIKTAQRLYGTASSEFKTLLEENFTKKELNSNVIDRVKSYEDACAEVGIEPIDEKEMLRLGFRQDEIDRRKLEVIAFALNEQEYLDWNNSDQEKWYPYFRFDGPSGFAFYATYCLYSCAFAGYASRLCFKSEKLARYAGETFPELYKNIIDNRPRA